MDNFPYQLTNYYKDTKELKGLCNGRKGVDYVIKKKDNRYAVYTTGKLAVKPYHNEHRLREGFKNIVYV